MPAKPRVPKPLPKRRKRSVQVDPSDTADQVTSAAQVPTDHEAAKPGLSEGDIEGLKYFAMIAPLLKRLHDEGCKRDKAKNRDLHFDQHCMLVLLYLFNPTITSLRALQQASGLENVKKKLGCSRASLGSLSEASRVFDSHRLKEIIAELGEQGQSIRGQFEFGKVDNKTITLVDGSLVSALPNIIGASLLKASEGSALVKWRLHTHFEVDRYIPTRIDVTPDGGGENDERSVMEKTIQGDRLYVMDRGYAKFGLFNKIVDAKSSYACRIRDNSAYEVIDDRELSPEAREADVLSDQVVELGSQANRSRGRPNHKVRLICVKCSPHTSRSTYRGKSTSPSSDGILRIATNLLDVPAEIIAILYAQRWQIEIFFRFFKQFMGCNHLISHNQNGIEIQSYCAIIACLLINLWTGRKPTKRTFEMLSYYFTGLASEHELVAHLDKLKAHDEALTKNR